jgi:ATP synthase protein I
MGVAKLVLKPLRRQAYRLVFLPILVALLIGLALLLLVGKPAGHSVMLGALVWGIPNSFVAYRLFANVSAHAANQWINSLFFAEAVKLLLTVVLFVLIIKLFTLSLGYFFVGFCVSQLLFWLLSATTMGRKF